MKLEIIPQHKLAGHKDALYSLLPSPDGQHFFSAGNDGMVVRWFFDNPGDGQLAAKVEAGVYAMRFLPNSHSLVIGTNKGGLHLVDLLQHRELHHYQTGSQPVFAMDWQHEQLFVAHGDGKMSRWQQNGLQNIGWEADYQLSSAALRSLRAHPTEALVATGGSDGLVRLLNTDGQELQRLEGHQNSVFSLLWLAQGKYLLSGSRDAHLAVWETASGKLLERFPAHLFTINHLLHLPEPGLVVSASRDKTIKIWNDKSLELLKVADYEKFPGQAHSHSVNQLLWHAPSEQLISVGDDRKIIYWKLQLLK